MSKSLHITRYQTISDSAIATCSSQFPIAQLKQFQFGLPSSSQWSHSDDPLCSPGEDVNRAAYPYPSEEEDERPKSDKVFRPSQTEGKQWVQHGTVQRPGGWKKLVQTLMSTTSL